MSQLQSTLQQCVLLPLLCVPELDLDVKPTYIKLNSTK
jgi:hypothetical protein